MAGHTSMHLSKLVVGAVLILATDLGAGRAHDMSVMRHGSPQTCRDLAVACATTISPSVAPDGTLWIAGRVDNRIFVTSSHDDGKTFAPPVAIDTGDMTLDWGPDARPQLAMSTDGTIALAFSTFRDDKFDGEVFLSRSTDGGRSFAKPRPITDVQESQRFPAIAFDSRARLVAAWLDKRGRIAAKAHGEKYPGAGLAVASSVGDGAVVPAIVKDNTCECCRIALAFTPAGELVVMFRNIFPGGVRDHAVVTFDSSGRPGPLARVAADGWKTDVCPHQGPSLAIAADGSYHGTWFTLGTARRGLFYARSTDGGATWSEPMALGPQGQALSRPFALAVGRTVSLAWKAFDGRTTNVMVMTSRDAGAHWGDARVADSTDGASDHPILVGLGGHAFLSWQTSHGYRLVAIGDAS